ELLERARDRSLDVLLARDVSLRHVEPCDRCALGLETLHRRAPDAARRARDERALACKTALNRRWRRSSVGSHAGNSKPHPAAAERASPAARLPRHDLPLGRRHGAHPRDVGDRRSGRAADRTGRAARVRVRRGRRRARRLRVRPPRRPLQPRGLRVRVHRTDARPACGLLQRLGAARHVSRVPDGLDHGDRDLRSRVPREHRPVVVAAVVADRARRLGRRRRPRVARREDGDAVAPRGRGRRRRAHPRPRRRDPRQARDRRRAARPRIHHRLPAHPPRRRDLDGRLRRERRVPVVRGVRGGRLVRRGIRAAADVDPSLARRRDRLRRGLLRDLHDGTDAAGVRAFGSSSAPLGDLARTYAGAPLADVIDLVAVFSAVGAGLGCASVAARMLYALGRDGVLRRELAGVSATGAPATALALELAISLALIVGFAAAGTTPQDAFFYLATIGILNLLVMYVVTNLGALRYLFLSGVRRAPAWEAALPVAGIGFAVYTLYKNVWPVPPHPFDLFPYMVAGWLGVGLSVAWAVPGLAERIDRRLRERTGVAEPVESVPVTA